MTKVALLLLTRVSSLGKSAAEEVFRKITERNLVEQKLYVAIGENLLPQLEKSMRRFNFIADYYFWAHKFQPNLDVRILLPSLKRGWSENSVFATRSIERLFLDDSGAERAFPLPQECLEIETRTNEPERGFFLDSDGCEAFGEPEQYSGVVIGGTFDRLHNGHKILMSTAGLLSSKGFTCGVTNGDMLKGKSLYELIAPVEERIRDCEEFMSDIDPSLKCYFEAIPDPYGPSIRDPDLEAIVASKETIKGAHSVNRKRQEKGLSILKVHIIDLAGDEASFDEKISSSTYRRKSVLGSVLRPPQRRERKGAYIIGLSGGIASGKSKITSYLQEWGAHVINCDLLGHKTYEPGMPAYHKLIELFGSEIVDPESGNVDRRVLGGKVFNNPDMRHQLEGIVWPEIERFALKEIAETDKQVVVVEAAVLLEAGWESFVDEVWICMVPREEAVERLHTRNKLPIEAAESRIDAQLPNEKRVAKANVVFCSLWDYSETKAQVEKAWKQLQDRLPSE